ncbi:hypothetical protein [Streptomyces sp. NPDC047108]|uniref:imidazolonepropionase-like domain-containing protein n=1 Tax=Streptomyces sp. NPDC047108 TaxID=3155025 RepID=UPI0033CB2340
MLTVHVADDLWPGPGTEVVRCGAVAVEGTVIAAVGPYEQVTAERPGARIRRWPGLLTPGLVNRRAGRLLEAVYHPDPREADDLGTEPVTDAALAGARLGASARRGIQRMLAHGTTAVAGEFRAPEVRTALARAGMTVVGGPGTDASLAPSLDPLAGGVGDEVFAGVLAPGGRADFAVFAVGAVDDAGDDTTDAVTGSGGDPRQALAARGAGTCVATVLGGRLVYRGR